MAKSDRRRAQLIVHEAEVVIRQLGRPVPLGELYDRLVERGVAIDGAYPKSALGRILTSRSALNLICVRCRGWWLRRIAVPKPERKR